MSKVPTKAIDIKKIDQIIEQHLAQSTIVDTNEVAQILNINPNTFKLHFKEALGKPFYQYYLNKKMEYAARLLKKGLKAYEVSDKIGYSHSIKFNKMFQKHFGITPKKYQSNMEKQKKSTT